jgi:acyl-CoA thioester hydrolase
LEKVATVRVIYGDTDAMGIVYYGNYLRWFEVGRAELMRRRWLAYHEMNVVDLHLPVIESNAVYRHPARYDDLLDIYAELSEARGVRLKFGYRIARGADGKTLVEGSTTHAFTDSTGKVVRPSERFRKLFAPEGAIRAAEGEIDGPQSGT